MMIWESTVLKIDLRLRCIKKTYIKKPITIMTTDIQSPPIKTERHFKQSAVAKALEISGARSKIATAVYKKTYIKEQFYDYDH